MLRIQKEMCDLLYEEENYIHYIFNFYLALIFSKKAKAILGNATAIGLANPLVTAEVSFNPHPITTEKNHMDHFQNMVGEAITKITKKRGVKVELRDALNKYLASHQDNLLKIFQTTSGSGIYFSEADLKNKNTLANFEKSLSGNKELVRLYNSWSIKDYNDFFNKIIIPILEKK